MKGLLFIPAFLMICNLSVMAQEFSPYPVTIPGVSKEIMMIPVKGGTFQMGSEDKPSESPVHEVKVGDFWMGATEVTWDQYDAFIYRDKDKAGADEARMRELAIDGVTSATIPYVEMSFGMGKGDHPAVNMTQYAALMYCKWLSSITGEFYRLPTEAEWEYACKTEKNNRFHHGDSTKDLSTYAVFNADSYRKVGSLKPGESGIFDLNGNTAEWTMDQYDESFYSRSGADNPWNIPETLYPRSVRGGSWKSWAPELTCTARMGSKPSWKKRDPQLPKSRWWHTNAPFVGFRIVRPLDTPTVEEIERYWLKAIEDYSE